MKVRLKNLMFFNRTFYYGINRFGTNVMICGKIVINTNVTKTGIKNGNTPLVTVETDIFPTRATTKRAIPIGGVRIPTIIFNVVITPKKIKSILNCIAIGISIGNTKNCNARASMNIPRKSNSALIIINTVKGESATATNTSATRIATC